jgi:hypothetical protein
MLSLSASLPAQSGERIATAMAENIKLLDQYSHKQRIEIKLKGEDKDVRINQVRFDPTGKRQETLISETAGGHHPHTPIRWMIADQKRNEVKGYVKRLRELVESYLPPNPEKLRASLAAAEFQGKGTNVCVTLNNYLKPGDSLALTIDSVTSKLQKVELKTTLDKDPIAVTADMASVPSGPRYPSLTKIMSPARALEIDISEYEFIKQ